jgi:signal transduction histidine kinase
MTRRTSSSAFSRRLLLAAIAFGLFVLFDFALFGWLIFRSLSEREINRVLLETRTEAEQLARQLQVQAEGRGKDLYTAIAVERETQTTLDDLRHRRGFVRRIEIRDKRGILVFRSQSEAVADPEGIETPVMGSPEGPSQGRTKVLTREYEIPSIEVPIGDLGTLEVGVSGPELARRVDVLQDELVSQASLVGAVTVVLLLSAYAAVWLLVRRASRLEAQTAEAERLAYIGTLASGLAHEIRNPLNSLNLNMQMLEEEIAEHGSGPTGGRLLSITRSELSRLERLVTDFLAYAKPRPLELEEMPAVRLFDRLAAVLAGEIQGRGVQLDVEDRTGGARVRVDSSQMNQLLLNLAQNALAALSAGAVGGAGAAGATGGRPPLLRLVVSRQAGEVLLEVTDNGIGIPPEELGRIFELFYSTRKGGTGLGLAIVERIAQAHGGRVAVRSTVGVGTTVEIALPTVAPEAPARERAPIESPAAGT